MRNINQRKDIVAVLCHHYDEDAARQTAATFEWCLRVNQTVALLPDVVRW